MNTEPMRPTPRNLNRRKLRDEFVSDRRATHRNGRRTEERRAIRESIGAWA